MRQAALEIRTVTRADDLATVATLLDQVWGTTVPIVTVELLRAISHAGGYVAAAFDADDMIGASFGFLARHNGQEALHSHVTGIQPGLQHRGAGRAIKHHQRGWAAERNIPWITWTFDPLVRRNAWFNIEVLQAQVTEYIEDFYGQMTDDINAQDDSDRLVAAWPSDASIERTAPSATAIRGTIATPDDIVALRRTNPAATAEWRERLRREFISLFAAGGTVTGFTRQGGYIVHTPA
jgi:predicted GNAT superfamily acetyltransferase